MPDSILEREILQQPDVVRQLIAEEAPKISLIAKNIKNSFDYILIAARGSSDNAARFAQYLFGTHNRIPVALATPSIFTIYKKPLNLSRTLVIGISQSGQSPDIVEVINEARRQKRPTIAVTNESNSPLAQASEFVISLHAGNENAVAATKTYTASLAALALFSAIINNDKKAIRQLTDLPIMMETVLSGLKDDYTRVERYRYMQHCAVVGRGLNYSTAFELSLKIKELTKVVAEPYSSADFRHGPIAMLQEGFPVIIIASTGKVLGDVEELISELILRKCELIVISDQIKFLQNANFSIALPPDIPEWLSPMITIIPGQIFSYFLALAKDLNPDKPVGIHKITETF